MVLYCEHEKSYHGIKRKKLRTVPLSNPVTKHIAKSYYKKILTSELNEDVTLRIVFEVEILVF